MILEVKNLRKQFHQGQDDIVVFSNLNLNLAEGESLAILGASGSGKTTLLSLIAGLDSPTAGEVIVAGQNLNTLSEKQLTRFRAEKLGIIFQQYHLFSHLNALENVALPLEIAGVPDAYKQAEIALQKVGLAHRLKHHPHQMSGGENQRVAFARAIVVKPKLLLADEPSGSLDAKTGDQVMHLLFELVQKEKMTLLLVTHNEELAKHCTHIFRFNS